MNFIAQDCDDNCIYLVSAKDVDAALALLAALTGKTIDDFDIVPVGLNTWPPDGEATRLK